MRRDAVAYAFVLLVGVLSCRALVSTRILAGHDATIYLTRLTEYHDSLSYGILLPRWAPHLGAGHGEPTWIFAPPLFQALCELVHLVGPDLIVAENITLAALLLFGGSMMFVAGAHISGVSGGLVASLGWFFAPYLLTDLFIRHAAAEFCAVSFLPLTIVALQRLGAGRFKGSTAMLAGGVAAVGFAHHGVLLIAFPALAAAAVALWFRDRTAGLSAGLGLLLGLTLAAWSWLPALAERHFVHLELLHQGFFQFDTHFLGITDLLAPAKRGLANFTVGPLQGIVAAAALFLFDKRQRREVLFIVAVVTIGILLTTPASAFIWRNLRLMQDLAFPWRFLLLPALGLPLLVAYTARRWPVAAIVVMALHAVMFASAQRPTGYLNMTVSDRDPLRIVARGYLDTSQDEYRPVWAKSLLPPSPSAFDPPLPGDLVSYTPIDRSYSVVSPQDLVLRLHTFFFPGWMVEIDGSEVPIHPAANGLIEFQLPRGRHTLRARFAPTFDRAVADIISIMGLLLVVLLRNGVRRSETT